MLWFKKKNKNEEVNYENYINEFINFKTDYDRENEYRALYNLYTEVKSFYESKINSGEIDINIERLLLERRAGKYTSEKSKANINILVGLVCALIPIYVQGFIELNIKYKAIVSIGSAIGLFIMILMDLKKDITKEKSEDVIYNICLKVLEDIENESSHKAQIDSVNEEVAATVKHVEQAKHDSNQVNGNWNVEISTLSIIDTVESVYKIGKFLRRMFRKN